MSEAPNQQNRLFLLQCSPQVLAQVRDNSWPVFFKTTYVVLVNLQKVAGGKKFLELLLEVVNFTGYRLIRRTLYCSIKALKLS